MHNAPPRRVRVRRRRIGAVMVIRHASGSCQSTCYACGLSSSGQNCWRGMLQAARDHAAEHQMQARYALTPQGNSLVGRNGPSWRRRLAVAGVVLVLAVIAFAAIVARMTSRAAPAPVPPIGVVTTTTAAPSPPAAAPATTGYRPTVAGAPATNAQGQWIPEPDPATTSTGGSR